MGEVRETVQGSGLKKKAVKKDKDTGRSILDVLKNIGQELRGLGSKSTQRDNMADNLVEVFKTIREEVSRLAVIKDEETEKEGKSERAENVRKAATLRAVHSLLTSAQTLLEDY